MYVSIFTLLFIHQPIFKVLIHPSMTIIQVGKWQPSNGVERDNKASKKAHSVKMETIKQEKLPPPTPPIICPKIIMIDNESGSDILSVSDSKPVNVCPILQSLHRRKTVNLDIVGGH